ncbi:MAG: RluA family pseudouridine synthase [Patescibacteria group bacterium]
MVSEPKVIYENDRLALIDKPAGWLTHSDGRTAAPTVTDWLTRRYPAIATVGEPLKLIGGENIARPGIVHRLDRDTSGIMVVAKDQPTYLLLKTSFARRQIKKNYRLIVQGPIKTDCGTIAAPIGRSRRDPRRRTILKSGRAAVTDYEVLKRFKNNTYLEAQPHTGRTHQLRVHFKSIQHPLLGDELYGERSALINRIALHSYCLELPPLILPPPAIFIAPLPLDFFTALASLE